MDEPLYVLLVSDNHSDIALVQHELERVGYAPRILVAANESDYFGYVSSAEIRPDLIIANDDTRELAGLQSLRLLREWDADIPYILLSNLLREELGLRALQLGAADYLLTDRVARLGYAAIRVLEIESLKSRLRRVSALRLPTCQSINSGEEA